MKLAIFFLLALSFCSPSYAFTDKAATYQIGTFVSSTTRADGTITSTLHGDGMTTAGSVYANRIAVYTLKVTDGTWHLETYTQNKDSMLRGMGMTPMHIRSEKDNPLDLLKGGERVLFRVEKHRKLNGIEISVYIPFAENPNKEFHFIGYFYPDAVLASPQKPTDNVRAMCDAHKLSPELEKQYCTEQTPLLPQTSGSLPASEDTSAYSPLDVQMAGNLTKLSCDQIRSAFLSNRQIENSLPYTWKTAQAKCGK